MANLSQQVVEQMDIIVDVGGLQFENLYPVLLQTFVVIVLGYVILHFFFNRNPVMFLSRPWFKEKIKS